MNKNQNQELMDVFGKLFDARADLAHKVYSLDGQMYGVIKQIDPKILEALYIIQPELRDFIRYLAQSFDVLQEN